MSSVALSPTQIIPALSGNELNVNNEVTEKILNEITEINTNKPPQAELIQDGMANQEINLVDYEKENKLFEDVPAENVASEDLPTEIKMVECVVPNNIGHEKETLDESVSQLIMSLQSPIGVKSKDIPNIVPKDEADESKCTGVDINYYKPTQGNNKDYRENSNDSLVESNEDGKDVLCFVDGNVKNIKDENENGYCEIDLPHQEKGDLVKASIATLTDLSNSSDEASSPIRSKLFTFTDSDFPDSDEIADELMSYPIPTVIETYTSESESGYISDDDINCFLRRIRKETKPVTKVDLIKMTGIEKLPARIMTRHRIANVQLKSGDELSKKQSARMFQNSYLKHQEKDMDEDIILENIKRIISFQKTQSENHKRIKKEKQKRTSIKKRGNKSKKHPKKMQVNIKNRLRKYAKAKCKSFARKIDKLDTNSSKVKSLDSISAANTTYSRTRSMNNENGGKRSDNKGKLASKKERSTLNRIEGRRSKRQQQAKEKKDDPMKAPKSIEKKRIREQSNISTLSSESPKSSKKSLVDDSAVPSPKRTRSYSTNHNNSINLASLRATPARIMKTQCVRHTALPSKEVKQDILGARVYLERYEPTQKRLKTLNSMRNLLNMKTRSQSARGRYHREAKPTGKTKTA